MARTKIDPTIPLYAMVGAGDLAVERARGVAADVQAWLGTLQKVDFRGAAVDMQTRLSRDLEPSVVLEQIDDLADRGKNLVERIRHQQATRTTAQAGRTTVAKAKTARTQTGRAASETASSTSAAAKTATQSARKTASTAKRNAKSTSTSARKTASAASKAASDGASKVGN
ncbi:MAG TPA: hypothetical protein VFT75_16405 [Nocardioidaceae bacterium]|nr:hypothetical protein [Nocardioidaceae bacterium]